MTAKALHAGSRFEFGGGAGFNDSRKFGKEVMMKARTLASILSCLLIVGLAIPAAAIAGDAQGAYKMEGAWIAKVDGVPAQWSYVMIPNPSGRRAVAHGTIDVGFSLGSLPANDEVTPILADGFMTGPKSGTYSSIWYGIKDLDPPAGPINKQVVWIGTAVSTFEFTGPNRMAAIHNFAFYLADQDKDGDGFPDEDETPVDTLQLTTTDTRLPSPY